LNPKLAPGEQIVDSSSDNDAKIPWLAGGKIGGEFGLKHLSIGVSLVIAGYGATITNGTSSNSYERSGLGSGVDFFTGYSWYPSEKGSNISINAGVTCISLPRNDLNLDVPVIPYLQLRFSLLFSGLLKLEFPVIDGKITPQFGLGMGLNFAPRFWALPK